MMNRLHELLNMEESGEYMTIEERAEMEREKDEWFREQDAQTRPQNLACFLDEGM